MGLIYASVGLFAGLFLVGFLAEILRWWFLVPTAKAKFRHDLEF